MSVILAKMHMNQVIMVIKFFFFSFIVLVSVYKNCPDSHAFAFDNGLHCCAHFVRASNNFQILKLTDPLDECNAGKRISCPYLPFNKCGNDNVTTGK